jgi:hypothetical protein
MKIRIWLQRAAVLVFLVGAAASLPIGSNFAQAGPFGQDPDSDCAQAFGLSYFTCWIGGCQDGYPILAGNCLLYCNSGAIYRYADCNYGIY